MSTRELGERARLVRDYAPVAPVLADDARLGQVFLNLIINAVQSFDGSSGADNEIRIVADNGSGIAPNVVDRILEPSFTRRARSGSPLGASVALAR
jgi:signal transduction histidine kinase